MQQIGFEKSFKKSFKNNAKKDIADKENHNVLNVNRKAPNKDCHNDLEVGAVNALTSAPTISISFSSFEKFNFALLCSNLDSVSIFNILPLQKTTKANNKQLNLVSNAH